MRAQFAKSALVVDEGPLASTVQARNLLRIADAVRIPRVVLVGDARQLDAVDAGKPFAQLQKAGMLSGARLAVSGQEVADGGLVEEQSRRGEDMFANGVADRRQDLESPLHPGIEGGVADPDVVSA